MAKLLLLVVPTPERFPPLHHPTQRVAGRPLRVGQRLQHLQESSGRLEKNHGCKEWGISLEVCLESELETVLDILICQTLRRTSGSDTIPLNWSSMGTGHHISSKNPLAAMRIAQTRGASSPLGPHEDAPSVEAVPIVNDWASCKDQCSLPKWVSAANLRGNGLVSK